MGYNMSFLVEKIEWFDGISERLRDYSEGEVWSDGSEILCRTEDAANALADMLVSLYRAQGDEVTVITGYYDPKEDEQNGNMDKFTGWWYVYLD